MSKRKPDILIVTGTCGVGKSTTSRRWSALRNGAAIHGDQIREWLRPHELRRAAKYQEMPILSVTLKAAEEFLALDLDVAIDNVWTAEGIARLYGALRPVANVRAVYLRCDVNENIIRDKQRTPSDRMNERLIELDEELQQMAWPDFVVKMNTSSQTPDETVEAIDRLFRM